MDFPGRGEPFAFSLMLYREIRPGSPLLLPYVRFFWTLTADIPLPPQLIVPDGCPELILHFGDPFALLGQTQPRAFVFGQIERAIALQPRSPCVDILGVRFHPAGLSAFTRVPQSELTGRMVECRDLWKGFEICEPRLASLERFLLRQLNPRTEPWREDLSSRQNRRRFLDAVGLAPKRLQRIERLQSAMRHLGRADLAQVAADAGYFDQAHFARDFRDFTGQTPTQYIREPHAISDFFIEGNVRNVQDLAR